MASNYTSASLYVGDLNSDITEALLFEIFNQVGPVASIRVCRDAITRRSLGYAYVNFHNAVDAERALDTMNYSPIKGRACRIMWSQRDPSLRKSGLGNIFVKNLDASIDNKTLFDTFSMFGNILSCKVAASPDGASLGYGFVHYESDESAQKAIENVNGMLISGKNVIVAPFKPKTERTGNEKSQFTNVFVKNLGERFTSERLLQLFNSVGNVTSHFLPMNDQDSTKSKGFGFVNYETAEMAAEAVKQLNDKDVDGKKLYVGAAMRRQDRVKLLKDLYEKNKAERQKKYAGVNLYVKNLDDTVDDEALTNEFSKFGNITSATIMKDSQGRSRGFGFVCFSTPEEAQKAVTEMSGKLFVGKPLYVALAQRKEVRRAQIEAQLAQRIKMTGGMAGGMPPQMYPNPMFYPGPQMQRRPYQFPQPMMPGRWAAAYMPVPMPQGVAPPAQGVVPGAMGGMPALRGGAPYRGGRGGARGAPQGGRGGRGGVKYIPNVRNNQAPREPAPAASPAAAAAAAPATVPAPAGAVLTLETLAQATPEMQKQMIGERLYPLIAAKQPELAGRITGMLLEMDNGELIHLIESNDALVEKVTEALQVLHEHELSQGETA